MHPMHDFFMNCSLHNMSKCFILYTWFPLWKLSVMLSMLWSTWRALLQRQETFLVYHSISFNNLIFGTRPPFRVSCPLTWEGIKSSSNRRWQGMRKWCKKREGTPSRIFSLTLGAPKVQENKKQTGLKQGTAEKWWQVDVGVAAVRLFGRTTCFLK